MFKSEEVFNYKRLRTIIDNWSKMPEEVKTDDGHGVPNVLLQIKNYLNKSKLIKGSELATIPVSYNYSKLSSDRGRLFAVKQLSLQNITRRIRHTITNDIYNDYDIKNAHPTIFLQYCEKRKYKCDELKSFVSNRDNYLKDLMDLEKISKDEAKRKLLSLINGGKVESNVKWFKNLKNEINILHQILQNDKENEHVLTTIKETKKYNIAGSLFNHIICEIENNILMACIDYLKSEKISIKNIVLCFDGFMIKKEIFNPSVEIFKKLSDFVEKKTGYRVIFDNKLMNEHIDLSGMDINDVDEEIIVEDDTEACRVILEKINKRIYNCKGSVYIKTSNNNIWTNDDSLIKRELTNIICELNIKKVRSDGKSFPYSKNLSGIKTIRELIPDLCPYDDNFLELLRLKSKGKIFFNDCVYDFSIGTTRDETDEDMTPIRINRNFPTTVNENIKNELINLLNSIFEKERNAIISPTCNNMLQHCARGLAGHIEDKDWVLGSGLRNCGKGVFTSLCINSFGQYVTEVNANNFINTNRMGSSDEAKNRMWILNHIWSRLVFANECDTNNEKEKTTINGVLIKSLMSGGDRQRARALFKMEVEFVFNGRLFMFMNEIPTIAPIDTCEKMSLFEFPNQYINPNDYDEKMKNNDLSPYERRGISDLKDRIKTDDYINAFIHLVLNSYEKEPVINCSNIKNNSKDYRMDSGDELLIFKDSFDFSDRNSFMSSEDVLNVIHNSIPNMSEKKIKSFLTKNMGLIYKQKKILNVNYRGYEGIKLKL
jgi:hypothetical protein